MRGSVSVLPRRCGDIIGAIMNAVSESLRPQSRNWLAPVFGGGILAGAIDLTYACTYHGLVSGVPPLRILQSIASGLFGRDSFQMGYASAAVGFVAHFFILIVAAAMFYAGSLSCASMRMSPAWRSASRSIAR